MGMGLCVAFIAFVRLPSLKVSTLLLTGLLLYDVFWVFFSSYIFSTNVMVKVATRPAENPVGLVARKLNLGAYVKDTPKLNLPGKLVFPSLHNSGHFSMLGLGDIVMPGLLLCFVLRYDAYKKSQGTLADAGVPVPKGVGSKLTYFHCSLLGWVDISIREVGIGIFRTVSRSLGTAWDFGSTRFRLKATNKRRGGRNSRSFDWNSSYRSKTTSRSKISCNFGSVRNWLDFNLLIQYFTCSKYPYEYG